ncbi:MAG: molybdopterin cofactor-binding domain-containing protein [Geminicoccaceae bacterium]
MSDWIGFGAGRKVELRTGRVELGQGAVTAILQIAAAELGLDPRDVTIVSGDTERTPDEGFTVGSLSVSQGGAAMAWAASAARRLGLAEVSRRMNAAVEELSVEDSAVLLSGNSTGLDLRDVAADLDFDVAVVEHGQPGAMLPLGEELPRIDLPARVLGAPFIHDRGGVDARPGRVLHPPARDARLVALDLDALARRSGVLKVVRNGDAVGVVGETQAVVDGAVAWAETDATWRIPEPTFGELRGYLRARAFEIGTVVHQIGDSDTVRGETVELVATRGYLSHGSIGPSAALAIWRDGHLTVESPTQGVFPLRGALARAFDLSPEAITVRHRAGAGCYGHNGADDAAADAAFLARAVPGTPVRVVWSRADEFRGAPLGPAMATRVSLTVSEGRLAAARIAVVSPPHSYRPGTGGAACLSTPARFDPPVPFPLSPDLPPARGGGADRNATPSYDIPAILVEKTLIHDLPYRTSAMRSLGAHLNIYAIELAVDAAARQAGADPVAFRLEHLSDPRAREVIRRVADVGLPEASETVAWGLGYGRYKNSAAYAAVAVEVELGERLRVRRARVALDAGRIVSKDGTRNQVEGGLLQAISWTLLEEMPLAGATGWSDYPILRFSDVPDEVEVALIDRPDAPSLGCAEALAGPTAAAIGIAAGRLSGSLLADLPLTPERITASL